MKNQLIGRNKELSFLTRSLSSEGSLRAALVHGSEGMGKSALLEKTETQILGLEKIHLCLSHKGLAFSNPLNFTASLARSARGSNDQVQSSLNEFGRKWGRLVISFERSLVRDENQEEWRSKLAKSFVQTLEQVLSENQVSPKEVYPVLILDDLDKYSGDGIDWLTGPFNMAIRASGLFKHSSFLFSSQDHRDSLQDIFDRFGFERVQSLPLKALDSAQCETLASLYGFQSMAGAELREISKGNPLKLLNIFKKSTTLPKAKVPIMSEQTKKTLPHVSDFTEEEFQHLLFASYFSRVNRYNLEFLCSPRDAAFSYNWLKRQKSIAKQESDGSLIINQEVRDQIQEFHRQDNPEEAERLNVIATIVDAFIAIFPESETHWIPIHLQALDSFTRDLCRKLFPEEEASEVFSFIDSHEEQIAFSGKQMSLNPDAKLLTKKKRRRMESEHDNLSEEATDIAKQVEDLVLLKEKILEDFRNPSKSTTKREFTFGSNKILLLVGLGTIAASLFSDSFGSYYAAIGIALTFGGFFWPNVGERRTAVMPTGASPRLAVETQQRSLDHRINGLVSRASSIKESLSGMSLELENLGQGLDAPYVSED